MCCAPQKRLTFRVCIIIAFAEQTEKINRGSSPDLFLLHGFYIKNKYKSRVIKM
jgi:hypothetical protein